MILVTGAAGFIGFHIAQKLLDLGEEVVGIDNLDPYYDPSLKKARLAQLSIRGGFAFFKTDLCDHKGLQKIFKRYRFQKICHMAAKTGVRRSLTEPFAYQKSNIEGFLRCIEMARLGGVENFVYASSSSVYGSNTKLPFSENDQTDSPVSLYATTKKANELTAHYYSHLFGLPCTGMRLFSVYGPWGRPDMALFKFTRAISIGAPIEVYNNGNMIRQFTYIDDAVEGILIALQKPARYQIYNVGGNKAGSIMDAIGEIEKNLGKKAKIEYLPLHPCDVEASIADIAKLRKLGYEPKTDIDVGIGKYIEWYREYYGAPG